VRLALPLYFLERKIFIRVGLKLLCNQLKILSSKLLPGDVESEKWEFPATGPLNFWSKREKPSKTNILKPVWRAVNRLKQGL
jgi:hypothetical protein